MDSLKHSPLLGFGPQQKKDVGPERVEESMRAQLAGRGLSEPYDVADLTRQDFRKWTPKAYNDPKLSKEEWSELAVRDCQRRYILWKPLMSQICMS